MSSCAVPGMVFLHIYLSLIEYNGWWGAVVTAICIIIMIWWLGNWLPSIGITKLIDWEDHDTGAPTQLRDYWMDTESQDEMGLCFILYVMPQSATKKNFETQQLLRNSQKCNWEMTLRTGMTLIDARLAIYTCDGSVYQEKSQVTCFLRVKNMKSMIGVDLEIRRSSSY